jgi:hypothetical protein
LDLKNVIITPNTYSIYVKARGDGLFYRDSNSSSTYTYAYLGPIKLENPSSFSLSSSQVLSWDSISNAESYTFKVDDRVYTILLNRFNLSTLNLSPGTYTFEVTAKGDNFNTSNSDTVLYTYRIYSETEQNIKDSLKLILELLYRKNQE